MKNVIIGDIHLDTRSGDRNFLKYQETFFEILYEYLEKNDDVERVIFLGDIFTNKDNINIKIMDTALSIMSKISSYGVEIVLIDGNHVIYYKNSYELNSVDVVFKNRSNLNIKEFRDKLIIDNFLFVNWKNTKEEYDELFSNIDEPDEIEYVFGHFEMFGFMLTRFSENKNTKSMKSSDISKYFPNIKQTISGHYHTPQEDGKVFYPGTPYQLSWNEAGLTLGFNVLEDGVMTFHLNPNDMYKNIHIIEVDNNNLVLSGPISPSLPQTVFKGVKDLTSYVLGPDEEYKSYYRIRYDDLEFEKLINMLVKNVETDGHKVTVINNFELFSDTDIKEDDIDLSESKSSKNNSEMNMELIIKGYIYDSDTQEDDKDFFYELFMALYEETRQELSQNFEL